MRRSSVPWSYNVSFAQINLEGLIGLPPISFLGRHDNLPIQEQLGRVRGFLSSCSTAATVSLHFDGAAWIETFGQLRDESLGSDDPWHRTILSSSDLTLHRLKWIVFDQVKSLPGGVFSRFLDHPDAFWRAFG